VKKTILSLFILLFLSACGMSAVEVVGTATAPLETPTAIKTLNPTIAALQTPLAIQAARSTQAARALAAENAVIAEQTAQVAAITADAYRFQAQQAAIQATAIAMQATADASARSEAATAAARATEQERAWVVVGWTATADVANSTATAVALSTQAINTVEAQHGTATAQAVTFYALATVQSAQAESAALAAERERFYNYMRGALPYVGLGMVGSLLTWVIIRVVQAEVIRRRAIPRDARGDAMPLVLQQGNSTVLVDMDKMPGPVTVIDPNGAVTAPLLADPNVQAQVTGRDQAVDLVTRGLPGTPKLAKAPTPQLVTGAGGIERVEPQTIVEIIREIEEKLSMRGGEE
jgi:hypothetical protein